MHEVENTYACRGKYTCMQWKTYMHPVENIHACDGIFSQLCTKQQKDLRTDFEMDFLH